MLTIGISYLTDIDFFDTLMPYQHHLILYKVYCTKYEYI